LKKIGGYALGSSLQTSKAAAIGHFFFAQSFRSGLTGLWATHPPLNERIRAIEPTFDGKMFNPPEVVNVESESFLSAGLAPRSTTAPRPAGTARFEASSAMATAGTLTPEQISNAGDLLASLPARLREAAHSTTEAPALIYGLLLDEHPDLRQKQRALIAAHSGNEAVETVDRLTPDFAAIGAAHKLPLVQMALPALRTIAAPGLGSFLETLDALMHSDNRISPFEFALQKLLTRSLKLGSAPSKAVTQYYSFHALAKEISVVLSTLAQTSTNDGNESRAAFGAGAAQLKLIEPQLAFVPDASDLIQLDAALDKLASSSGPIKQRTLLASAHVVSANGSVSIAETELLRAIAAALDVPLPPLLVQ